jgi:hypothetical protein
MKVVINKCFGGFGLSPRGYEAYAKKKGKKCYFFENIGEGGKIDLDIYYRKEASELNGLFFTAADTPNLTKVNYGDHVIWAHDIPRDDPDLIAIIEELGEAANSGVSELKIIEIPDGTEYTIEEYDGIEHIAEVHRTWG